MALAGFSGEAFALVALAGFSGEAFSGEAFALVALAGFSGEAFSGEALADSGSAQRALAASRAHAIVRRERLGAFRTAAFKPLPSRNWRAKSRPGIVLNS